MKKFFQLGFIFCAAALSACGNDAPPAPPHVPMKMVPGKDGWAFWEGQVAAYEKEDDVASKNAEVILDFDRQLKKAGIRLVLVPVPDQLYMAREKWADDSKKFTRAHLDRALEMLGGNGVSVVRSVEALEKLRAQGIKTAFTQETHLMPQSYEAMAALAAARVQSEVKIVGRPQDFTMQAAPAFEPILEMTASSPKISMTVNRVANRNEKILQERRGAEVMIMGDSHANAQQENGASFSEQLAKDLGVLPDVRCRHGEGMARSLRIDMARQKDNLAGTRVVVWIFREATLVTEAEWKKVDVIK